MAAQFGDPNVARHVGQLAPDRIGVDLARDGDQQREAKLVRGLFQDLAPQRLDGPGQGGLPAIDRDRIDHDLAGGACGRGQRHHEDRHAGRVVGPLHEGQPGDDPRRAILAEPAPPGAGAGPGIETQQAEIGGRGRDGLDHRRGTLMRHQRHREAEMEARRIPHRGIATRDVGMHRIARLHIGEGRDDDAPDALDRIERQLTRDGARRGGASWRLPAPGGTPSLRRPAPSRRSADR